MPERVILVYGLWMNPLALYPLGRKIEHCGYRVTVFRYATVGSPLEENAQQLADRIAGEHGDTLHLVGHSLGGLVILRALALRPGRRIKRVVLLGSPVAGSLAGRNLGRTRTGRWMLGKTLPVWSAPPEPVIPPGVEVGVLAGNMPIGLGRLVARLPRPNDGAVALTETRLKSAADSIVLPVTHTAMIFSGRVARQVCAFLKHGKFLRDRASA
jgi:pimeloyl-ACP methyl ester carboxylesterase